MAEPVLVAKNLDGMREGTQFHARAVAAEFGLTLTELRRVGLGLMACRDLERRGLMRFEPPISPAEHPARPGTTERACMCCREPFQSEGNHHRLCPDCNKRAGQQSPLDIP